MVEAIEKESEMMAKSIDRINARSLVLEDKWLEPWDKILHKQIQYFKARVEATNYTQLDMVQTFNK